MDFTFLVLNFAVFARQYFVGVFFAISISKYEKRH